jgi:hypothetical protein
MKQLICISVTVFLVLSVTAQTVKQEVISSAGGFNVNDGISISWTLGETIIPTFKSADKSLILTHGFQQQLIITAIEENLDAILKVNVYPNPASEIVNLRFDIMLEGDMKLVILDSQGKQVITDLAESGLFDKQINLQGLPAGIYYLKLTKGKLTNVYKIVKF